MNKVSESNGHAVSDWWSEIDDEVLALLEDGRPASPQLSTGDVVNGEGGEAVIFADRAGQVRTFASQHSFRVPGDTPSGGCNEGQAGVQPLGRDHLGWLYSDTRCAGGRGAAATLAAWIRACQAPRATSSTSRMITDSTLSAAMPSGQRQLPTSV